jgi:hypothetical protein
MVRAPNPMSHAAPEAARSRRWSLVIFATCLALAALRTPQLLVEPRFWAEEGSLYYAAAWNEDSWATLAHVPRPTAAYLNLAASIPATLAARWLPVERAPFVTTWAAFAVLAVALALVSAGRARLWRHPLGSALASAAVLLAPSALGEAWLNSINAMSYCALIALAILCEDLRPASARRGAAYAALLSFCGLSGPYTSFLFPAFAWKAWAERSRAALWAAGAVAFAAAIQVAVFAWAWSEGALNPAKLEPFDLVRSAMYTGYGQLVVPLGLGPLMQPFSAPVLGELGGEGRAPWLVGLALLGAAAGAGMLLLLVDRDPRGPRNGLVIALACLALLTTASAHHGRAFGRYSVVSGFGLLWLVLARAYARDTRPRFAALAAAARFGWALAVGAAGYRRDEAWDCPGGCPRWREEVARWRVDPAYHPQIWPVLLPRGRPQWRVPLAPPLARERRG